MFKKYHKLTNHYESARVFKWVARHPELNNMHFVITEKIHGCNFQIHIDGDKVKFGSRNHFINDGLFGVLNHVWKIEDLINSLKDLSKELQNTVTLYGEFFGQGIHKELKYGEKSFRFFALHIGGEKIPFSHFLDYMSFYNQREWVVPILGYEVGLMNALKFNENFDSFVSTEGDVAEGVVIEPLATVFKFGEDYVAVKKKSEKFLELAKMPVKRNKEIPSDVLEMKNDFLNLVVDARLQNIFSKEGSIKDRKQIGKYVKLLIEDAKEEFYRLYPDIQLDKSEEKVVFNIGNRGFNLIKEHM